MNRRAFLTGLLSTAAVAPAVGTVALNDLNEKNLLRLLIAGQDAYGNLTTKEIAIGQSMRIIEIRNALFPGIVARPVPWNEVFKIDWSNPDDGSDERSAGSGGTA